MNGVSVSVVSALTGLRTGKHLGDAATLLLRGKVQLEVAKRNVTAAQKVTLDHSATLIQRLTDSTTHWFIDSSQRLNDSLNH